MGEITSLIRAMSDELIYLCEEENIACALVIRDGTESLLAKCGDENKLTSAIYQLSGEMYANARESEKANEEVTPD